jgi:RNA polymerase primary sigma factor
MKRGNRRTNHSLNSIFDSLDSEEIYLSSKEANHDLLSFQEEVDLFRKASNGDIEAKNKIILQNQKLVMSVAYKYRRSGSNLEFMDLIQYGNIGLLEAIKRFEVNRGLRFSTYAQYWIKAIIQRNSTKNRSPFSISERAGDSIRVVNNAISQLSQCLEENQQMMKSRRL